LSARPVADGARSAFDKLVEFLKDRQGKPFTGDFEAFEREFWERVRGLGREVFAEELAKADVDREAVVIEGKIHRRVLRSEAEYMTTAGPVKVERTLYKDRSKPWELSVAAFDLRMGVIGGFWLPSAAEQGVWLVSQMTPLLAEEALKRVGNMVPSKSSLDRLPKEVGQRWEENREEFEKILHDALEVPEGAMTVAISLDGVLVPMKDGDAVAIREEAAARGEQSKGPAGYREVGCGTLSFCDARGELLSAIRIGRMPEYKKLTLKASLLAEVTTALTLRPGLRVIKIADAARDNWDYLSGPDMPPGPEVVDFFHAAEHLNAALASVYGDGTHKTRERFAHFRHLLLEEPGGVEKVVRGLAHLRKTHPRSTKVKTELSFFRRNRSRMTYAELRAEGYPIGSGVVEAACKTLAAQRMKQSGMRWGQEGGQAILTTRGWSQSGRFDAAWAALVATYKTPVTTLDNVVPLRPRGSR
jgi:hypothetical protein